MTTPLSREDRITQHDDYQDGLDRINSAIEVWSSKEKTGDVGKAFVKFLTAWKSMKETEHQATLNGKRISFLSPLEDGVSGSSPQ